MIKTKDYTALKPLNMSACFLSLVASLKIGQVLSDNSSHPLQHEQTGY